MGIAEDEITTFVAYLMQKTCSEKINILAVRGIGTEFQPGDQRKANVIDYGKSEDGRYFVKFVVYVDDESVLDYGARLWIDEIY
jgi:hypothetical protein